MGNLVWYVVMMVGIVTLFHLGGLVENTPNAELLKIVKDPQSIQSSSFLVLFILAIEGAAVAGLAISAFALRDATLAFTSALAVFLLNFFLDFLSVFLKLREASEPLALLIMSPILILYIIVLFDWWRGRD